MHSLPRIVVFLSRHEKTPPNIEQDGVVVRFASEQFELLAVFQIPCPVQITRGFIQPGQNVSAIAGFGD